MKHIMASLGEKVNPLQKWLLRHEALASILVAMLLVIVGALVFYLRYPFAFEAANFYAEDGKIFMKNLIEFGPVVGLFQLFNGYLIVGQYMVGVAALVVNELLGSGFVTLPKAMAVASYLFFGFVCVLPWILFRKRLGLALSLIVVVLLWATPLGSYDAAVIGTIGNLKFSFLFIAVLLVIYRNDELLCRHRWQFIAVDIALLLCVCTNIVTIGLLPFALIRYSKTMTELIKMFSVKTLLRSLAKPGLAALLVLVLVAVTYVLFVYLSGIPKQPGYLDQPLDPRGLLPLSYRATAYGLFFPINHLMTGVFEALAIIGVLALFLLSKYRAAMSVVVAALALNIIGFVYNRTGVTLHFLSFSDAAWPGHFFMAGTMIVVFGLGYIVADTFKSMSVAKRLYAVCGSLVVFALILPAAGFTKANPYETTRPALASEVERVCAKKDDDKVMIEVYPAVGWTMQIDRDTACSQP